jgi:hypothetical protein
MHEHVPEDAPTQPRQQAIVDYTGTRAAGDTADFLVNELPTSLMSQVLNFDTVRLVIIVLSQPVFVTTFHVCASLPNS